MKRLTRKRWIVVGMVVAMVVALVVSTRRSEPMYSVRVVRYAPGDTNALVEITNNVGTRLEYCWRAGAQSGYKTLGSQQAIRISIPIPVPSVPIPDPSVEVIFVGRVLVDPWMIRRCDAAFQRFGIDLFPVAYLRFTVTTVTGWVHPRIEE